MESFFYGSSLLFDYEYGIAAGEPDPLPLIQPHLNGGDIMGCTGFLRG
jgi:hypothetical protein